jgi:rRNA maturation endonuclease Nob1
MSRCPACGSQRIIPDVKVVDKNGSVEDDLRVVFYKSPTSLIFKGRVYSEVRADVCGKCGHVELRIADPEKLYDAYLSARSAGPSAETEPEVDDWDDLGWDCPKCGKHVADDLEVCWNCGMSQQGKEDPDFRRE